MSKTMWTEPVAASVKLTPAECAGLARVSVSLVYAWCRSGALKHYRLGRPGKRGKIVIEKSDFDAFLESLKVNEPSAEDEGEIKWLK